MSAQNRRLFIVYCHFFSTFFCVFLRFFARRFEEGSPVGKLPTGKLPVPRFPEGGYVVRHSSIIVAINAVQPV